MWMDTAFFILVFFHLNLYYHCPIFNFLPGWASGGPRDFCFLPVVFHHFLLSLDTPSTLELFVYYTIIFCRAWRGFDMSDYCPLPPINTDGDGVQMIPRRRFFMIMNF